MEQNDRAVEKHKKVAVSACLLGENCKYNGGNNQNEAVLKFIQGKEVIPVCPEVAGGLSTPRVPVELVHGMAVNRDGVNVDKEFRLGVERMLQKLAEEDVEMVILQPRSPSCGTKQIYDGTFTGKLVEGQGMFAKTLIENGYKVLEPEDLKDLIKKDSFEICEARKTDALTAAMLAIQMWEDNQPEELAEELEEIIRNSEGVVFLGKVDGEAVGFAQCQLRHDYVEGTGTSPVGYLEGIFVKEEYRKKGLAKQLLAACEEWAREQGCAEFASDCELDNAESLAFHLNMGFEEANRVICFTKSLENL